MTIREIRRDEVPLATDQYLEACRLLWERDADWGVPDRDRSTAGSFARPSPTGRSAWSRTTTTRGSPACSSPPSLVIRPGIAWARDRGAGPIQTTVGLVAPWTEEELSFWSSMGFEHDQALVTRYFPEDEGC